jgi:DNA-binding response OmpR family regulator
VIRILLVEDDARVASFIKRGLREERYAVDLARDGEEALFLAQTGEYDLMILDLLLPKCSGLEVLRTLRTERVDIPEATIEAPEERA